MYTFTSPDIGTDRKASRCDVSARTIPHPKHPQLFQCRLLNGGFQVAVIGFLAWTV